ncbi:hypothetical protein NM688_g2411 [Phlebia brevispora]|uniref:Uncharacterized protein n=1 Tax=Phlebia brevispora TaxID=194682 RepID=A0ACC1T8E5_9APHY|nr:hypothetical protein NM688_g2411 [Phlebia brevispora]
MWKGPPSETLNTPCAIPPPPPIPEIEEPRATSPPAPKDRSIRSSFAPSKQASQRKAQAQAQQAASQATMNKPGKAGRRTKPRDPGAWGESSDEEEEEEDDDEDDEDVDSDEEPPRRDMRPADQRSLNPNGPGGYPPSLRGASPGRPAENGGYPQGRQRRDLPQVPQMSIQTPPEGSEESGPQRRLQPDQFTEAARRSIYPDGPRRQPSPQNMPGAARQNVWSQALERDPADQPVRDTFVQLEPPSQTMTKAFAPHGLLYAGMQDKQDRSAKRQEELARETGASLINVPTKPPPPQTGLLGAVSAHERERKREGGLGAALTEREREKRVAEERQRKLDDFQRMQLEQMQQGGSMYGGMGMAPQLTGFNPMMNPMMMGMNPMMTGWGYPGMMNPQHMFAAQQAAQAYQQAMVAFSTAGSQVGGGEAAQGAPLNPMMTGQGMMGGYDPRMSMMMPMMAGMNPAMTGMNPAMAGMAPNMTGMAPNMTGMNPGMGMGQVMNPPGVGLGMQMTGGSTFDIRLAPGTPGNDGTMRPMTEAGPSQLPYSSQNSSANGLGTPSGPRSQDPSDEQTKRAVDDLR